MNVAALLLHVDADARRSRRRAAAPRASSTLAAPATQPVSAATLFASAVGHRRRRDDVGDREATAGLEHAERLAEHRGLVGRQVDHAVREDDVDGAVGDRQVLDLAEPELDVRRARACAALARAFATISAVMSTPITRPRRADLLAPRGSSRSRRRCRGRARSRPAASAAIACGLPQPRPRFAPSGTAARSSAE